MFIIKEGTIYAKYFIEYERIGRHVPETPDKDRNIQGRDEMREQRSYWRIASCAVVVLLLLTAGTASAAVDKVICVPWQGDVTKHHTALSGQNVKLKGVIKTTDTSAVYYKWVFGDGSESAVGTLSGAAKYNVEALHTYTAATGTPFTAKLQVSNTAPPGFVMVKEDPYLVKVEAVDINARINIAIDKGLWWLYKQGGTHAYAGYAHTFDGSPQMTWVTTQHSVPTMSAPTASAVHAFGLNGHKYNHDPNEDPYVDAVRGGMNYLVKGYWNTPSQPELMAVAIGNVTHGAISDDPDANDNGLGIKSMDGGNQPHALPGRPDHGRHHRLGGTAR